MLKKPTTYEEQMNILKSRGIIVDDEDFCLKTLASLNYYRISAYMLPYKSCDNAYSTVAFSKIYDVYEFDRQLRGILLIFLEEIELVLRTKISYYHAHTYGETGYLDSKNYNSLHNHEAFIREFNTLAFKNKDNPFVKHHIHKYKAQFPIWVAVELFPFGMLSRFYADMHLLDKKSIARKIYGIGHKQLESWLICLSTLRNRCAHYMRLYDYKFSKWPNRLNDKRLPISNTVFDYIYVMKYIYHDDEKWDIAFISSLAAIIEKYSESIELRCVGFTNDWREQLLNNPHRQ